MSAKLHDHVRVTAGQDADCTGYVVAEYVRFCDVMLTTSNGTPLTWGKRVQVPTADLQAGDARMSDRTSDWPPHIAAEWRRLRLGYSYKEQRRNARSRGFKWQISKLDYMRIWVESGHVGEQGRGRGKYVLARKDRFADFTEDNVYVAEFAAVIRSLRLRREDRPAEVVGVYRLYPGLAKSWVAQAHKKQIGLYATQAEAAAAREAALAGAPTT